MLPGMNNVYPPITTFSLVARDPETGDLAVAVASKFLAVGAYVPYIEAGVGAVATQAHANTSFGPRGLELLREGHAPSDIVPMLLAGDELATQRQFGIVAADGRAAYYSGENCLPWAGGTAGENYAAQGNILTEPDVVDALVAGLANETLAFPERMLAALAAADAAGGDKRGRQSASLMVYGKAKGYGGYNDRWIDLRVDDHEHPIEKLAELLDMHRLYFGTPSDTPHALTDADVVWLQRVCNEAGYYNGEYHGRYDEAAERALAQLFGTENMEERWIAGPRIDPVAWRHIRRRYTHIEE